MDSKATQHRQQIEQTRAVMTAKLDLLEQRVAETVAMTVEQTVVAPVRGLLRTTTEGTALLQRYPWLIIVGGALLGSKLRDTNDTPQRPVQSPPQRAVKASPTVKPAVARATPRVYESPRQPAIPVVAPEATGESIGATTLPESRPSPWKLGGLGVKELARRVVHEIQGDECFGRAAQLAYYFLFALFPFFLFLATLLGYLPIPNLLDRIMEVLAPLLPGEALRLVQDNLHQLVTDQRGGLLSFGILAALWTSSSALTAITDSLNRAYDVEEGRPFWKVRLIAIGLTVGLSAFIVVALVLLTFGPQLGRWVADLMGLGRVFEVTWNITRWPVIVGSLVVAIGVLYYFAPDVEQEWKWVTPGSACAVLGWLLASLGFAFYVNNFGSYNATYGSVGAVIVLLTWMYVTGLIILIGGEINAEIEHAAPTGKDPGGKQLSAP
jgi:membrane protein